MAELASPDFDASVTMQVVDPLGYSADPAPSLTGTAHRMALAPLWHQYSLNDPTYDPDASDGTSLRLMKSFCWVRPEPEWPPEFSYGSRTVRSLPPENVVEAWLRGTCPGPLSAPGGYAGVPALPDALPLPAAPALQAAPALPAVPALPVASAQLAAQALPPAPAPLPPPAQPTDWALDVARAALPVGELEAALALAAARAGPGALPMESGPAVQAGSAHAVAAQLQRWWTPRSPGQQLHGAPWINVRNFGVLLLGGEAAQGNMHRCLRPNPAAAMLGADAAAALKASQVSCQAAQAPLATPALQADPAQLAAPAVLAASAQQETAARPTAVPMEAALSAWGQSSSHSSASVSTLGLPAPLDPAVPHQPPSQVATPVPADGPTRQLQGTPWFARMPFAERTLHMDPKHAERHKQLRLRQKAPPVMAQAPCPLPGEAAPADTIPRGEPPRLRGSPLSAGATRAAAAQASPQATAHPVRSPAAAPANSAAPVHMPTTGAARTTGLRTMLDADAAGTAGPVPNPPPSPSLAYVLPETSMPVAALACTPTPVTVLAVLPVHAAAQAPYPPGGGEGSSLDTGHGGVHRTGHGEAGCAARVLCADPAPLEAPKPHAGPALDAAPALLAAVASQQPPAVVPCHTVGSVQITLVVEVPAEQVRIWARQVEPHMAASTTAAPAQQEDPGAPPHEQATAAPAQLEYPGALPHEQAVPALQDAVGVPLPRPAASAQECLGAPPPSSATPRRHMHTGSGMTWKQRERYRMTGAQDRARTLAQGWQAATEVTGQACRRCRINPFTVECLHQMCAPCCRAHPSGACGIELHASLGPDAPAPI